MTIDSLYCQRKVVDSKILYTWCQQNGIENINDPDSFHLTVAYSKKPVFWDRIVADPHKVNLIDDNRRSIRLFEETLVLAFRPENSYLQKRFDYYIKNGCSWDFPSYVPHISLATGYSTLPAIHPYAEDILLGPEMKEKLRDNSVTSSSDHVYNLIEAYVKTTFLEMVVNAAKENKIKVTDTDEQLQSTSLRYKNLTMIIRPDTTQFLFFSSKLESLNMNSPGFESIPTPKTQRGMSAMLKRYRTKYDKAVELIKNLNQLEKKEESLKNSLKINGVIDRLGSVNEEDEDGF